MNKFFDALTTKDLFTENGMPTHSTSGSFLVDFFYEMGGYRAGRKPLGNLIALFYAAFGENPNMAVKALFNLRDPRGGMQEKHSGRILWHSFAKSHPELVKQLLPHIPALGRWDDLFYFLGTPVEEDAMDFLYQAILSGDKLAAKWTPREGKRGPAEFKKGAIASYLRKRWELSWNAYRDLLVKNTQVVENLMCGGNWEGIVFQHVPSQAMKKYRNAFKKHQEERYGEYLEAVERGEEKINTGTLSPVEIVQQYMSVSGWSSTLKPTDKALETLWNNLPDVVPDGISFMPVCDLSGSMTGAGFSNKKNTTLPIFVSMALGIYLSQRNKSIFQNGFITFSRVPTLVQLTGKTLHDNLAIMSKINMAENTDIQATFRLILKSAIQAKLSAEDMPTHLLIISDMQFDSCTDRPRNSVLEMVDRMYAEAGYKRPQIMFWNVATAGGIPVKTTDTGVALVSGFSPNLLLNVLRGDLTPLSQVMAVLNVSRYEFVDEIVR